MTVHAPSDDRGRALRSRTLDVVLAAGFPAIALVVFGGIGLGAFLWYGLDARLHPAPLLNDLMLGLSIVAGVAAALAGWFWYGSFFSRHGDATTTLALWYDSFSWGVFALLLAGFVAPLPIGSPGRAAGFALALACLVKLLVAARFNATVRDVLVTFVVTRLSIVVIAELAYVTLGQRPGEHVAESSVPLLAVWGRWDAVHYLNLAEQGYYGTEMAFFPLYPLLIHLVAGLTGNHLVAGLVISNVACFAGLLYFYRLVEHQYTRAVAHRAVFYVSIFPTAIFFSAVYTEALFFALTVASFYHIRERRWITAGLFGAFAALTRVEGVLLVAPFAIEAALALRAAGFDGTRRTLGTLTRMLVGLALVPLGLAVYMAYLWVLRGDPLYFSHVQAHWNRHLAPPWVAVGHAFKEIAVAQSGVAVSGQVIEIAFTILMIAVLAFGIHRLRVSFWVYMLLSIAVPMSTSSLMSMPRFALVLFPMFVVLALWGGRSAVNNTIVAFSLPLLGLFTVLFADWYWVA